MSTPAGAAPWGAARARYRGRQVTIGLVVVAMLALQLVASSASAQVETEEINTERARREQIRQQQVELARFMDPLIADDAALRERVRVLEEDMQLQQARLLEAQSAIAQAENRVLLADAAVGAKDREHQELKVLIANQAIEAYVQPNLNGSDNLSSLLTASDFSEAGRRRALLDEVGRNGADLLDALRGAEERLVELREAAEAAVREEETQRDRMAAQVIEVEQSIGALEDARVDLAARMEQIQEEIDAFALIEDEKDALIAQLVAEEEARLAEEERQRREEERRRIEAERAALAQAAAEAEAARLAALPVIDVIEPPPLPPPQPPASPESANDSGAAVASNESMIWPTSGPVTSGFGPRTPPTGGASSYHEGIDISAGRGTPVVAVRSGTVRGVLSGGGFGNYVIINHGGGVITLYAHLSSSSVSPGQEVSQGTQVGTVGCTGICTGPHLHFEVHINGTAQNPLAYL